MEKYLQREVIRKDGYEYNVSTTSADMITWMGCYANGYRPPRHPVPAIRQGFDYGLGFGGRVVMLHWTQGVYDESPRSNRRE